MSFLFLFIFKLEKIKVAKKEEKEIKKRHQSYIYIFLIQERSKAVRSTGTRGCHKMLLVKLVDVKHERIPQGWKNTLHTNNYLDESSNPEEYWEAAMQNIEIKNLRLHTGRRLKVAMQKSRHSDVRHETKFWTSESASINCYQTKPNRTKTSEGTTYFAAKWAEWHENKFLEGIGHYHKEISIVLGKQWKQNERSNADDTPPGNDTSENMDVKTYVVVII